MWLVSRLVLELHLHNLLSSDTASQEDCKVNGVQAGCMYKRVGVAIISYFSCISTNFVGRQPYSHSHVFPTNFIVCYSLTVRG